MSADVRGVDVSSWQHPEGAEIDWEEVAQAGYKFALVKATQGTSYVNPWAARDLDDARAAGFLVGAYHYYEAGVDPVTQAKTFINSLIGQVLDLGGWLDWEVPPMSEWAAAGEVGAFLGEAHETRPGVGLYCDESWAAQLRAASVPLGRWWSADWSATSAPAGSLLWQVGPAEVPGITGQVDTDVLVNVRAFNIPTAPRARPNAATARPVTLPDEPAEPDEQPPAEPGTTPVGMSGIVPVG